MSFFKRAALWILLAAVAAPCCALAQAQEKQEAATSSPSTPENWEGRRLQNVPTDFIFGYGSLISTASRNATATKPISAIPVRVSAAFGYIRTWNDRSPSSFTALGLRKARDGEAGRTINGVLYAVDGNDMSKFDEREKGYMRVEVPLSLIGEVGWQRLPSAGHVWTYVPVRSIEQGGTGVPGVGLPGPDFMFPLLQTYIDVVIEGALEYGPEYARELIETTEGWSHFWLNDRELARRPWVHDRASEAVDAVLMATPGAAAQFSSRTFPEMYAERIRARSAR